MSNRIAVVAEAQGDFEVAAKLIDETLIRTVDWVSEADIDTHRIYVGRDDNEPYVRWQALDIDRGNDYRRAVRRAFGEPLPRHEIQFRIQRAIYEFTSRSSDSGQPMPFIVVVKDTDAKGDVREALQDARVQYQAAELVIGMQHTELECWLIAAFEPQTNEETLRLAEIRQGEAPGVGFDPLTRSEILTATKRENEKLSPKRVLSHLTGGDWARGLEGLKRSSRALLKHRGGGNGLADFLADIEQRLVQAAFNVRVADQ